MNTKKYIALGIACAVVPAGAATLSRVDVNGTRRMDAESVRILAGVNVGDNITSGRVNEITFGLSNNLAGIPSDYYVANKQKYNVEY